MFRVHSKETGKSYRVAVAGLLLLSAAALGITLWELVDFAREQAVVDDLIRTLPADENEAARFLAGELRWQFRLTILVVLNVVVTAIAIVLLGRAYQSSQESLRDIKSLAGDILSSMDQAVITTDLKGRVTSINRRGLNMLNPDKECVGRPLAELSRFVPLEEFRIDWMITASVANTRDMDAVIDGRDRVMRTFCQKLSDIDGTNIGFVLQVRDVTDRVLIEERMRRMERYMGLGSLAAGLHHEIKNPLAALSLHVQLLEEQLDEGDTSDEVRQMLDVIKTEVARVGGVLESFRDFAATGALNCHPVDFRDLIQRQVELIKPQATQQSVETEVTLADDLPTKVRADRARLEQVLLNVLINSLEAMPDGGLLLVVAAADTGTITIEVSDTGKGVPDDLREKIFDPYFTTKSKGTGLGLALSDKIVREHGGSLDLRSSQSGTTLRIVLPIAGADKVEVTQ